MARCLTAPSHYLYQCWLIISKVHWHSHEGNFTRDTSAINKLKNYLSKSSLKSHRDQWVKSHIIRWKIIAEFSRIVYRKTVPTLYHFSVTLPVNVTGLHAATNPSSTRPHGAGQPNNGPAQLTGVTGTPTGTTTDARQETGEADLPLPQEEDGRGD